MTDKTTTEIELAGADRFSNALTEIGEATINLIKLEREACARVLDEMITPSMDFDARDVLARAAKAIRSRPTT
jgi:hypothetical protein